MVAVISSKTSYATSLIDGTYSLTFIV